MSILMSLIIPIFLALFILFVIGLILYLKNKKVVTEFRFEKEKFDNYQKKIYRLLESQDPPKKVFADFEKVVKDFFRDYYKMDPRYTYLDLSKRFKKINRINHSKFCIIISELKYSNEEMGLKEIRELISAFRKLTQIN